MKKLLVIVVAIAFGLGLMVSARVPAAQMVRIIADSEVPL